MTFCRTTVQLFLLLNKYTLIETTNQILMRIDNINVIS